MHLTVAKIVMCMCMFIHMRVRATCMYANAQFQLFLWNMAYFECAHCVEQRHGGARNLGGVVVAIAHGQT